MCYKDRCFCSFYLSCQHGDVCSRALTPEVEIAADKWWGKLGAPIDTFAEEPDCFVQED
jgi:hypothetical protein